MNLSFSRIAVIGVSWVILAACDQAAEKSLPERDEVLEDRAGPVVTSLTDIEGFWLIERFEDFKPSWRNNTPWRSAYVQIDNGYLTYNIGCNQTGNPAAIGNDGVLQDTGDGSRIQTLQGCDDERSARDGRFFAFFGENPEVRELGSERIRLKTNGSKLVLVRPAEWLRENIPAFAEIEGRWVPVMATTYEGWGSSGFGLGEEAGVVTVADDRVMWSKCPELPIATDWSTDGRLVRQEDVDIDQCRAVNRATNSGPRAILTMLTASPVVIRTGPHHIVLIEGTGEQGRRIDLQSEESILNPPRLPPVPKEVHTPPPPPAPPPPKHEL